MAAHHLGHELRLRPVIGIEKKGELNKLSRSSQTTRTAAEQIK